MRVTIRARTYEITTSDIEQSLRGIQPEEGMARYFVKIAENNYPIKQVISQTLDLPKAAFTSSHAFTILSKLGYNITRQAQG